MAYRQSRPPTKSSWEVSHYREGLERIEAGDLPQSFTASYRAGLEREINRAAETAVDGDNQYMREVTKSDQDIQRTIDQIELSRTDDKRTDRWSGREGEPHSTDTRTNNANESALGGVQGTAQAEQHRDSGRDVRSTRESGNHFAEQQPAMAPEQMTRHPDERVVERKPALEAELARSDPPQQHVPRLRQIELEHEELQDRDRDDRER